MVSHKELLKMFTESSLKFKLVEEQINTMKSMISFSSKPRAVERIVEPSVIKRIIEDKYDVDITKRTRKREYIFPRSVTSYFLHKYTLLTLNKIAIHVGVNDHATVLNHIKKINDLRDVYPEIQAELDEIDDKIKNHYDNLYGKIDTDASNSIQTL